MAEVRGMILAAGHGTRLAPVTDHLPKPLLPVPGGTVLDRAVAAVVAAGVAQIAVNTHHLGDRVAAHLAARDDADRFTICHEPEILGTGGALDGAREFLAGADRFLLHNGDVLSDVDLGPLLAEHRRTGALATLVLVDWPAVNSVETDADGAVLNLAGKPFASRGGKMLTYAGIGAFDRALLDDIGPGFSSLVDPLARAIAANPGSVRAHVPTDPGWSDLGTLARWLDACPTDAELEAGPCRLTPLTGHGSDRLFWRLAIGDWSAVAMRSPADDAEFDRAVAVAGFLHEAGLGGAEILAVDEPCRTLLMEDVGAERLVDAVRAEGPDDPRVADLYRAVVDRLLELQAATQRAATECPLAVDRTLDRKQLAWEAGYFAGNFLAQLCGSSREDELADEFALLNETVAAQPLVLMHRDFQSENIVTGSGRVRLVDVQGMRLGPLGYDAASALWDPYVDLPRRLRDELVGRFARGAASAHGLAPEVVVDMVHTAALQRLMQALGAFAFLGVVKGRRGFLAHRARGVAHLRQALDRSSLKLPRLRAVLGELPSL